MKYTIKLSGITGGTVGLVYSLFIIILSVGSYNGDMPYTFNGMKDMSSSSFFFYGIIRALGGILSIIGVLKLINITKGVFMLIGGAACGYAIISISSNVAFIIIGVCVFIILAFGGVLSFIYKDNSEPVGKTLKSRRINKDYGNITVAIYPEEVNIEKNNILSILVRNALYCRSVSNELYAVDLESNMIIINTDSAEMTIKTKDMCKLTEEQRSIFDDKSSFEDFNYIYDL